MTDGTAAGDRGGAESGPPSPGLYGKLCAKGDFVSRRLPSSFVGPWDAWLQVALAESRQRLGEDWLPAYMTAPIWRFVLSSGLCGEDVVTGVLMPSVDRVGRHFQLALVALLGPRANPWEVFLSVAEWFVLVPVANIVSSVPLAPGGWGLGEAAFKVLFEMIRANGALGVAVSVLFRLIQLSFGLIGGVFLLLPGHKVDIRDIR